VIKVSLVFSAKSGADVAAMRTAALLSLGLPALGTAPGVVGKAFRRVELLFPNSEVESSPAIGAKNRFVCEAHGMASSLANSRLESGSSRT
jgi:hypothetical protein